MNTNRSPRLRRWAVLGGLSMAAIAAVVWAASHLPLRWRLRRDIERCETIIQRLDDYKAKHGEYPGDIPLPSDRMFYDRVGSGFRLGFSVGFDETYTYESLNRKWSFEQAQ